MKVGFILECSLGGPDAIIYPYVAKEICKALEIEKPETLKDKKSLLQEAPLVAKTLLENGCQKVFIIWDRKPRWKDNLGNCDTDKKTLVDELKNIDVTLEDVYLCCIDEMLESWLIADGEGVTNWINRKTSHTIKPFPDHKAGSQNAPKDRIKAYLKTNYGKWQYNEFQDNLDILKELPDFKKAIKWNSSFAEFANFVNQICPK